MEVTIEKLIYGGDGLARLVQGSADFPPVENRRGKTVFVPFVLEGERIAAEVMEERPGFIRARAARILQSSPLRIAAGCRYFGDCGGCHYQHTSYEHQLEIKRAILAEAIRRGAKLDISAEQVRAHPSPPWNYRNRTRMKLRVAPFALGYYRFGSHELLPVEECPISSPLINRAIRSVWELGRAGEIADEISEIEFFANSQDTELLVELSSLRALPRGNKDLLPFATSLRRAIPEVVGVTLIAPPAPGCPARPNLARWGGLPPPLLGRQGGHFHHKSNSASQQQQLLFGTDAIIYRTADYQFHVTAGSFFQTNRHMTDELLRLVTAGEPGTRALDLYSGVGLFTLPLASMFREVTAVESSSSSVGDLKRNCPANVRSYESTTEAFLRRRASKKGRYDLVVVDPPRAGLGEGVARLLADLASPRLIYVSCDPATLARDLRVLAAARYRITEMHLIDLFPQTFHIESVTKLVR